MHSRTRHAGGIRNCSPAGSIGRIRPWRWANLPLESGEAIRDFEISYVTHGTRSGAVRQCHSDPDGDRLDPSPAGFSDRAGRPLDPDRHFIICADAIGNGLSTSPSNSLSAAGSRVSALYHPRHGCEPAQAARRARRAAARFDCRGLDGRDAGAAMGRQRSPIGCAASSPLCRWRVPVRGRSR